MNDKLTITAPQLEAAVLQLRGIFGAIHHWTMTAAQGHHHGDAAALETVIDHLCVSGVDILRSVVKHAGKIPDVSPITPSLAHVCDDEEGDGESNERTAGDEGAGNSKFPDLRVMTAAELRADDGVPDGAAVLVRLDTPIAAIAEEIDQ